jgi:nucleotide-binding universal stress UspA family protein
VILICYDASEDARAAVAEAAELFPAQQAVVISVWEPFAEVVARSSVGWGLVPSAPDSEDIDQASSTQAEKLAAEGADLANKAGMAAESGAVQQMSTTGRAILAEAERRGAGVIVMGSRGLTGLKSMLLGSVSHDVIQHADRTVVVVPSAAVAESRAAEVRRAASES